MITYQIENTVEVSYYPKIGMSRHKHCYILREVEALV